MPSNIASSPQSSRRAHRLVWLTSCLLVLLPAGDLAWGKPATGDMAVAQHAEASRAAQLRHARTIRGAARQNAQRLVSHAAVGTTRPMFGWPTLVTEARKYIGTNPTARKRLWCATFMNMVLAKTGYAGTGSDAAKSFASYGRRINEPKVGAIAVLTRGKSSGHVGIVTGIDPMGNPIIISGNHGHRVGEASYPRGRVIAYVLPTGRGPEMRLASAGPVTPIRSDTEREGLSSPIEELLAAINAERAKDRRAEEPRAQAMPQAQQPPREMTRAAAHAPERAAPKPAPYRIVQQGAAAPEQPVRVATAYHVRVVTPAAATPLPRPRTALAAAPLPRNRPVN